MNFLSDFQQYYEQNVRAYEALWKQQQYFYERKVKDKRIVVGISLAIVFILFMFSKSWIWALVALIIIGLLVSSERKDKSIYVSKMKEEVVKPAIRKCYSRFSYSIQGVSEETFRESNMYYDYDKFTSSDMITGKSDDREFIISEITLTEKDFPDDPDSMAHEVFHGAFIKMEANYSLSKPIYIEPNVQNKKLDLTLMIMKKAFGVDIKALELENEEFRKVFKIYFQDDKEASNILTKDFMDKFLRIHNRYNAKMYFAFQQNNIYVLVSNLEIVDVNDVYDNGISKSTLYGNLKVIQDIMDLAESVATKE